MDTGHYTLLSALPQVPLHHWSGRAAGFDLAPSHNVLTEAQHQAWLDLLREVVAGFIHTTVRPLMDAALWPETPTRPRFMVTGRRPVQ